MIQWGDGPALAAARTGAARAAGGGVAVSGVVHGDVSVAAEPRVHSGYLRQVERISPPALRGREAELAALAAFCTEPDPSPAPYLCWRAPAWAGKSALLSWFVLHPPAGTRIVSFFVTARLAGQSDRIGFCDVVLEQLAELLDVPLPRPLTEATREAHLLRLLDEAAHACRERGERLVLVVDGLDEDAGVAARPGSHSIAALLPARPEADMRVIVAGRPSPPVPDDVPAHHPLRDPAAGRALAPSPYAAAVRADAENELRALLDDSGAERDVLALLAASGGGLSGPDLVELTGVSAYRIERVVRSVAGRTLAVRREPGSSDDVYVLAHEELRGLAARMLGEAGVAACLDRLHAWADRYRGALWPPATPGYLLRGYFRRLAESGDTGRMVACALDGARHDRMLEVTGGDASAFAEIGAAQAAVLGREEPDLTVMARLALCHDGLGGRNQFVPTELPALWATLGESDRAEALAHGIPEANRRWSALMRLSAALGPADADRALRVISAVGNPAQRSRALTQYALRTLEAGHADRAEALTRGITDPAQRVSMLTTLAHEVGGAGDPVRAVELLGEAGLLAPTVAEPRQRAKAIGSVAWGLAVAGEHQRGWELARSIGGPGYERARALAHVARAVRDGSGPAGAGETLRVAREAAAAVAEPRQRTRALAHLALAVAQSGDGPGAHALIAEAEAAAALIASDALKAVALRPLLRALVAVGEGARARALVEELGDVLGRARGLAALAEAWREAGAPGRAAGVLDGLEELARSVQDVRRRDTALTLLAWAVAGPGQRPGLGRSAGAVTRDLTDTGRRVRLLTALAQSAAAVGDRAQAGELARELDRELKIVGPGSPALDRAHTLVAVAAVLAVSGAGPRARELAEEAGRLTRTVTVTRPQLRGRLQLAWAVAKAGDPVRAAALGRAVADCMPGLDEPDALRELSAELVRLACAVGDLGWAASLVRATRGRHYRVEGLTGLARQAYGGGDGGLARRLLEEAAGIAAGIPKSGRQATALAAVADALAACGDPAGACDAVRGIRSGLRRAQALAHLAGRRHDVGGALRRELLAEAEDTARGIAHHDERSQALATVVSTLVSLGDADRAGLLVREIPGPRERAQALRQLAGAAEAAAARRLLARSLQAGGYAEVIGDLEALDPAVLYALADAQLGGTSG